MSSVDLMLQGNASSPSTRSGETLSGPINVSQVKQLSPFRYPGGKTWCVPELRRWISTLSRPKLFVEPFAGGAIASLTVAFEQLADHVVMVEKDADVAAVWRTILGRSDEDVGWLCRRVLTFKMDRASVLAALEQSPSTTRERAFRTILKNRVNRGGIMARGASLQKNGENGRGIGSRWYPETLVQRIKAIREIRTRIMFRHDDAFRIIDWFAPEQEAAFFVDPPYTAGGKRAGARLYTHNCVDHPKLFDQMAAARGSFMMTYDDSEEVRSLARLHRLEFKVVPMKSTHHALHNELLITRGGSLS